MRGERVEWPIAKDNGELATGALACPMLGLFPSPFRLDNSRAGERKGGEGCVSWGTANTVSRLMDR